MDSEFKELKVGGKTIPSKLAGAIVKTLEEGTNVVLIAIGADANNQAVKGMGVSNTYLAPKGKRLDIIPAFGELEGSEKEITTMLFYLKAKHM